MLEIKLPDIVKNIIGQTRVKRCIAIHEEAVQSAQPLRDAFRDVHENAAARAEALELVQKNPTPDAIARLVYLFNETNGNSVAADLGYRLISDKIEDYKLAHIDEYRALAEETLGSIKKQIRKIQQDDAERSKEYGSTVSSSNTLQELEGKQTAAENALELMGHDFARARGKLGALLAVTI